MRNDQIFVLLLVILLPMSGCFDGAVGDAEAEEGTSETTQEATPTVNRIITIQVEPDETVNITLNGTALEFVSGWNCPEARTYCSMSEYVGFVITCDDLLSQTVCDLIGIDMGQCHQIKQEWSAH